MTKIIFAGTPEFAVPSLAALIKSPQFEILAVLTQPDRPKGRGQKLQASPIKTLALQHHLPILQPSTLKDEAIQNTLKNLQAEAMIVAAYGLLLPEAVLNIPKFGCINVHGSLLPRWRGAAPVQRAIEAGDKETGITLMHMEKGLDTGGMFYVKSCSISEDDTGESLMKKLADLGAEALLHALPKILSGELKALPQNDALATYAHKLEKQEGLLKWEEDAEILARRIRAFYPWPGCYFEREGQRIKVGEARVRNDLSGEPGKILSSDKSLIIACKRGALQLTKIQFPGGKMQGVDKSQMF